MERSASSCMKCQSVVVVDPDGGDRRVANLCLELLQAGERVFERLDCVGHDDWFQDGYVVTLFDVVVVDEVWERKMECAEAYSISH